MIKKLTLEDKAFIIDFFERLQVTNGELSFTNLMMWDNSYNTRFFVSGDTIFLICGEGEGTWAFCPQSLSGQIDLDGFKVLVDYFESIGRPITFKRVWEEQLPMLKEAANAFGLSFEEEYDRDNSDYVYLKDKLLTLSGKKLHSKRNHLNYFVNNYSYKVEILDKNNIDQAAKENAIAILKKWNDEFLVDDELVSQTWLVENLDKLEAKAILISIDGEYVALAIAEMLKKDTLLVHTEKADHSIRGLYQAVNKETVKAFEKQEGMLYVNREQDCGDEGLRKAKTSYHPVFMINKYTLTKK